MVWQQTYDPFSNTILSTVMAALPVVILLGLIAWGGIKAHIAALVALAAALAVAVVGFGMPGDLALRAAVFGALQGLFPIVWIILNVMFLYRLTVEKGWFDTLKQSIAGVTSDRRLQLLLVAYAFGAFFEAVSGFGTPVAVTGAILIGLGFSPLAASGLALIANTAPVAYGALGTPIAALSQVTGIDAFQLGAMVGRQLPFFGFIVPFWLIAAFAGWRGMISIWPAITICGLAFAIPQFLISNYINPWIVDLGASIVCLTCLTLFLRVWQPKEIWTSPALRGADISLKDMKVIKDPLVRPTRQEAWAAWIPWLVLSVIVGFWGSGWFKDILNKLFIWKAEFPGLHNAIMKAPPIVAKVVPEPAIFNFNFLSATGTAILIAAILAGLIMRLPLRRIVAIYFDNLWTLRFSIVTIVAMLAIGNVTRFSGLDATLGLAFAGTGVFYPFFGTLIGWLGVALTGSDTASNVLFGGLQQVAAKEVGVSPVLMAAANSSGGVMGKMIDAQSIVVASTATGWFGHEGAILRFVFWHSVVLACLVGGLVMLQAYVAPFTWMVIH